MLYKEFGTGSVMLWTNYSNWFKTTTKKWSLLEVCYDNDKVMKSIAAELVVLGVGITVEFFYGESEVL